MNILIVEDTNEKAQGILRCIETLTLGTKVASVGTFIEAIRALQEDAFDLLILDLCIPVRQGESPEPRGGEMLLREVVSGGKCKRPAHIVGLTQHEALGERLIKDTLKNLVHVVYYSETNDQWKSDLTETIVYIKQRLVDAETISFDYKADVAIVTSSPLVELREVRRLPGNLIGEFNRQDAIDYYRGEWLNEVTGRKLLVVACAAPQMGMTAACATTSKVIERWRPRFIAMSGIAAGTKEGSQGFGDVLIAQSSYDYGSGKMEDDDSGKRIFIPSPNPLNIDADLGAVLQRWEQEQYRAEHIWRAWDEHEKTKVPTLRCGIIASGAAVVQSQSIVDEVIYKSRKVVGIEMEAYGVFHAAHLARAPRPRVLIAKSICDFANCKKNDDWQRYAAFTSARFLFEFFTHVTEFELGTAAQMKS